MCNYSKRYPVALLFWLTAVLAATAAAEPTDAAADSAGTLTIHILDIRQPEKDLYLAVYDGKAEDGWDAEPVQQLRRTLPDDKQLTLTLELPVGRYAVRAFVDISDTGQLDTRSFDRPQEPFAISLGKGRDRPSRRFAESVFTFDENSDSISLLLHYPRGSDNSED